MSRKRPAKIVLLVLLFAPLLLVVFAILSVVFALFFPSHLKPHHTPRYSLQYFDPGGLRLGEMREIRTKDIFYELCWLEEKLCIVEGLELKAYSQSEDFLPEIPALKVYYSGGGSGILSPYYDDWWLINLQTGKKTLLATQIGGRFGKIAFGTYQKGEALTLLKDGRVATFDFRKLRIKNRDWRLRLRESGHSYGVENTRILRWRGNETLFLEDEDLYLGHLGSGKKILLKKDRLTKNIPTGKYFKSEKDFMQAEFVGGDKVFYVYGWFGEDAYDLAVIDLKSKREEVLFSNFRVGEGPWITPDGEWLFLDTSKVTRFINFVTGEDVNLEPELRVQEKSPSGRRVILSREGERWFTPEVSEEEWGYYLYDLERKEQIPLYRGHLEATFKFLDEGTILAVIDGHSWDVPEGRDLFFQKTLVVLVDTEDRSERILASYNWGTIRGRGVKSLSPWGDFVVFIADDEEKDEAGFRLNILRLKKDDKYIPPRYPNFKGRYFWPKDLDGHRTADETATPPGV